MKFDPKVVEEFGAHVGAANMYQWDGENFQQKNLLTGEWQDGFESSLRLVRLHAWNEAREFYQSQKYRCPACTGRGKIEFEKSEGECKCGHCLGDGYVPHSLLYREEKSIPWPIEMEMIYGIIKLAGVSREDGMKGSIPFALGDVFTTLCGTSVTCIELSDLRGYECARFSDGAWRYNRPHDRGRCTGSRWDAMLNIVPKFPPKENFQFGFVGFE